MMTRTKSLTLLLFTVTFSFVSLAQNEDVRMERLQEILKEKTAILGQISQPVSNQLQMRKTAGSTEKALSGGIGGGEAETFVAINPTNSDNLVASFMSDDNILEFPIYYTNDGGLTWTKSNFNVRNQLQSDLPGHIVGGGGDPVFTYDNNGTCYFSWIYLSLNSMTNPDTAFMNMFWAYSTNGGQTWQVESNHRIGGGALLMSGGGVVGIARVGEGILDRQWMAADRSGGPHDGNIYTSTFFVPHSNSNFPDEGMTLSRKTPSSNAFQMVSYAAKGSTQFGNIEVDQRNGNIHITYCDLLSNELLHTVSINGGNSFSTPVRIAYGTNFFPSPQNQSIHPRENAAPSLAVDGSGNLHMVWSDFPNADYKSYYSASFDNGATWSTPKLIDDLLNGGKAFMPTISASGDKVSISCHAISSGKKSTYKSVSSMDNGNTFTGSQNISGGTTDFQIFPNQTFLGDYNKSVMENCSLYSSWSDGRLGFPVVYVAKTDACAVISLKEFSPLNADVSIGAPYPQPAGKLLHLPVNSLSEGSMTITLLDVKGSKLMEVTKGFEGGGEISITLDLPELISGTYLLMMETHDGLLFTRKVITK